MKKCRTCLTNKPLSEFHKASKNRDGYAHHCRECKNTATRTDYHARPESVVCECGAPKTASARSCATCKGQKSGSAHHSWKGGVTNAAHGYLKEQCPDHPAAEKRGGYVLQHRLVMERTLGRYLYSNENVHHKNGNRKDNRPENLELWVKSQPPGQRVEDLVGWAKEILTRYG